jgi:Holliday junction resolvase RusA-like endonuclease
MCFDCDNVIKGLCDALEESKIISDDRRFSSMFIEKFRTTNNVGRIDFELQTFKDNPIHEG